ncbi:MAG: hypothetical protein DRI57_12360 [Deltaproteobacteria bacterium]|nr:MAG: hypothetical protein DRI57_12360 [Deltaproteobacteria bacterium]
MLFSTGPAENGSQGSGRNEAVRFGALRRTIFGISEKMLIQSLRELEKDGVVRRKEFFPAHSPCRLEWR